jgi:hypothetical protein
MKKVRLSARLQRWCYAAVAVIPGFISVTLHYPILFNGMVPREDWKLYWIGPAAFLLLAYSAFLAITRQKLAAWLSLIPQIPMSVCGLYLLLLFSSYGTGSHKEDLEVLALVLVELGILLLFFSTAFSIYITFRAEPGIGE